MPLIKTGRKRGRPSRGWGWSWFGRKQDPHLYDLLEMLLMGEPLQPYALPKKLDAVLPLSKPRNHTKLSDNLRDILQQAKVRAHALRNGNYGPLALNGPPTEDILSENYTDEVIRQQAIELVRQAIISKCPPHFLPHALTHVVSVVYSEFQRMSTKLCGR